MRAPAKANDCLKTAKASSWPELEHRLRNIFDYGPPADTVTVLQSKYSLALAEIGRFMKDERVEARLGELAAAMGDLVRGTQPAILRARPRPKGGQAIDESVVWNARVIAVLGLE
jgi:hypothetical protein